MNAVDENGFDFHHADDLVAIAVARGLDDDADGDGGAAEFDRAGVMADRVADEDRRDEFDAAGGDGDEEFVGVFADFDAAGRSI